MKGQRRRTPALAASPLRRGFPSFTSSYVFGGAAMIRRSGSSNSAMAADEALAEGRSASARSPTGSSCAMSRPSVRAGASMPRSRPVSRGCRAEALTGRAVLRSEEDALDCVA